MVWDIQTQFKRHAVEIKRWLRGRGLTDDVAADLTQDAFVRLMTVKPPVPFYNPRASSDRSH